MHRHVFALSATMAVLGLSGLALSPGCNRPLEVQKGDYLLHAASEPAAPAKSSRPAQPLPSPDPAYHPE
jgi:hypothetical protein